MVPYEYECSQHGRQIIYKPMAESGLPCYCQMKVFHVGDLSTHYCNEEMRRIYNPQRIIIRPRGYSLRPGEYASNGLGYSTFDYELERGELTEDPTPVYTPEARAKREEALAVASESRVRTMAEIDSDIPERAHQELHEWARAVHSHATEG